MKPLGGALLSGLFWFARKRALTGICLQIKTSLKMSNSIGYPTVMPGTLNTTSGFFYILLRSQLLSFVTLPQIMSLNIKYWDKRPHCLPREKSVPSKYGESMGRLLISKQTFSKKTLWGNSLAWVHRISVQSSKQEQRITLSGESWRNFKLINLLGQCGLFVFILNWTNNFTCNNHESFYTVTETGRVNLANCMWPYMGWLYWKV